ncbi:MAG: ComEA family DNA-binding protein [Calditrichia bacterium]
MYFSQSQQRALFFAVLLFILSIGARTLWHYKSSSASHDFSAFHARYLTKLTEIRHAEKLDSLTLLAASEETKTHRNISVTAQKVNPNSASKEDLQSLPGIGPKMADRIIHFRNRNGKFRQAEDLLNVKGIGKKSLKKIRQQLSF